MFMFGVATDCVYRFHWEYNLRFLWGDFFPLFLWNSGDIKLGLVFVVQIMWYIYSMIHFRLWMRSLVGFLWTLMFWIVHRQLGFAIPHINWICSSIEITIPNGNQYIYTKQNYLIISRRRSWTHWTHFMGAFEEKPSLKCELYN